MACCHHRRPKTMQWHEKALALFQHYLLSRGSLTMNRLLVRPFDKTILVSLYTDALCEHVQYIDVTFVVLTR
jgi:hypothetical protein